MLQRYSSTAVCHSSILRSYVEPCVELEKKQRTIWSHTPEETSGAGAGPCWARPWRLGLLLLGLGHAHGHGSECHWHCQSRALDTRMRDTILFYGHVPNTHFLQLLYPPTHDTTSVLATYTSCTDSCTPALASLLQLYRVYHIFSYFLLLRRQMLVVTRDIDKDSGRHSARRPHCAHTAYGHATAPQPPDTRVQRVSSVNCAHVNHQSCVLTIMSDDIAEKREILQYKVVHVYG